MGGVGEAAHKDSILVYMSFQIQFSFFLRKLLSNSVYFQIREMHGLFDLI